MENQAWPTMDNDDDRTRLSFQTRRTSIRMGVATPADIPAHANSI